MPVELDIKGRATNRVGVGVEPQGNINLNVTTQKPGVGIKIETRPPVQIKLNARRTLDGNILIMDHEDVDIVIIPNKSKCLILAKEMMSDSVYGAQDRLCKYLIKSGIADPSSVRAGNIYGSMECSILESRIPGVDNVEATLFSVFKYLQEEVPYSNAKVLDADGHFDDLLKPASEDSTDLGEIPQAAKKGTHDSRLRPFGYMYNYSLLREERKDE